MFKIINLIVNYGAIRALGGINIAVKKGDIAVIIGANGAGKTTTLMSCLRLVPIVAGDIIFRGESIRKMKGHNLVGMGLGAVLEGRQLFTDQTVEDNLLLGAYSFDRRLKDRIQKNIRRELERFPVLLKRRRQLAGTLSGGEQQMLAFARAMMTDPEMVLLDEPTMGLSPRLIQEIVQTIEQIRERGVTILWVEQMAYIALSLANRAYLLETGRIVKEGTGKDLLDDAHVRKAYLGG